ncbi:hypothetical protein AB1Y20_021689 [Prymnesium parvum]|uniref:Uncharacterized protein n=1 Tax=Prymnesium parvum TaxID=97485 RepID=A0AB34JJF0_PRYPA
MVAVGRAAAAEKVAARGTRGGAMGWEDESVVRWEEHLEREALKAEAAAEAARARDEEAAVLLEVAVLEVVLKAEVGLAGGSEAVVKAGAMAVEAREVAGRVALKGGEVMAGGGREAHKVVAGQGVSTEAAAMEAEAKARGGAAAVLEVREEVAMEVEARAVGKEAEMVVATVVATVAGRAAAGMVVEAMVTALSAVGAMVVEVRGGAISVEEAMVAEEREVAMVVARVQGYRAAGALVAALRAEAILAVVETVA